MMKFNTILVFYFGLLCDVSYFVYGAQRSEVEKCDNICFRGFKEELGRLSKSYKTFSVSNIPSTPDDINTLINTAENIILNIKNIDEDKNKSEFTYDTIFSPKKLELLDNAVDEINLINAKLNEMKRKRDTRKDAFIECVKAGKLYGTLRDDVENVNRIGKKITTSLNFSKCVEEISRERLNTKKSFDELRIPEYFFQSYVCNSTLQARIQDGINSMKDNANLLQSLFERVIKSKLKTVQNYIHENGRGIKNIGKILNEEIPTNYIEITHETRPIVENLRNTIKDFKNNFNEIKLDKTFEEILENVTRQLTDLLDEYKAILIHMFSKDNTKKIKREIETARTTLQLLKERDALKTEFKNIKQVVDILKDRGICFINETVSVEDKIILP